MRQNSKSPWCRSIPGKGDRGQRFVVHYKDGTGEERPFGYSDTPEGAQIFCESIEAHPVFHSPRVQDRGITAGK